MTDEEIIESVLAGNTSAFEYIIRRNNAVLYKTGRSYGFNHHDTEDLMQETYLQAFKNLSQFENRSSLCTWLVRIMLNQCYQKSVKSSYKNEGAAVIYELQNHKPMFHSTDTLSGAEVKRELGQVIENAISKIDRDHRMVFTLREMAGLSVAETAETLQISSANVKTRLNRAKSMLRKEIEKVYSAADIYEFNLIYCDKIVESVMNKIKATLIPS
jgi:RNA polymerase sigma factor (sigma-70 family)